MMPDLHFGWHMAVLLLSLTGFALLALSSEREGQILLRRQVRSQGKQWFRWLGCTSLGLALWLCAWGWQFHFGTVLWLGWLSMAAVVLVFAIAYWPWRNIEKSHGRQQKKTEIVKSTASDSRSLKALLTLGWGVLFAAPVIFTWSLLHAAPWPVLRADAVKGEIGPWRFTLAEEVREAPEVLASGAAVKHFVLRIEGDELAIAKVWLRLQPPRSLRTSGMAFEGRHGNREVMIAVPPSTKVNDDFWLTVLGQDGQEHRASIPLGRLSPATADFVEGRQ